MIRNDQEFETTLARIRHFKNRLKNSEKLKPIHRIMSYQRAVFLPKSIG